VARISTTIDPLLPLVLVSADTVDLAILGGAREVHVVVPPLRAEDVVACVERVLLDHQHGRVEQLAQPRAGEPPTVVPVPSPMARPTVAPPAPRRDATPGPPMPRREPSPKSAGTPPPPPAPWPALARQLLDQVAGLPSVAASAQRLADEVATECAADVAVLVHQPGAGWSVEGGVGLRPLEWGQRVEEDHWLVQVGRERGPGLQVPDTDTVRANLIGAPLASRPQLARYVSRDGRFMICVGWSGAATTGDKVVLLAAAAARHEQALADALQLRAVAEELCRIVEPSEGESV
jgi:hypothetical protein